MLRRGCLFYFFAASIKLGAIALEVTSPQSLVTGRIFDSATFAYYGPQSELNLRAPGVILERSASCNPDFDSLKGKIVVIGEWWPLLSSSSDCKAMSTLGKVYDAMNREGVIALVFVSHLDFFPVGSLTYHFDTWDRCRFCEEPMVLVHVSTGALAFMNNWCQQPELEFNLNPREHTKFRSLFYSAWWTLCFRVLLPAITFITSLEAALEIYRIYSTVPSNRDAKLNRSVTFVVCCIEAPCMLLVGLGSMLGLYGPYAIPVQIANMVFVALQGAGILTTFLLGLHLAEECRLMTGQGLERRSIFQKYTKIIAAMGLLTLGLDILSLSLSVAFYYFVHRFKIIVVCLMSLYTVLQGIAGCFFISYSSGVKQPMLEYLKNVRIAGTNNTRSRRKIGHLVFWLSASAVIMVLASIGMMISLIFMSRGVRNWGIDVWPFAIFYIVLARVLVAAAQVNAVRPVDASTPLSRLLMAFLLKPIEFLLKFDMSWFRKKPATVEHHSTSDSDSHEQDIEIRTLPSRGVHPGGPEAYLPQIL
jgi:hypothetical protein